MIKCPKSVVISDIRYPYGEGTRYCPLRRIPCVLETDDADKCGIAKLLLNLRDTLQQAFENTCDVRGLPHDSLRNDLQVSANYDIAAEEAVAVVYEDLDRWLN